MKRTILTAVLTGVIGLSIAGCDSFATAAPKPCPTEDSIGCTWDALARGNHSGRSFIARADGTLAYYGPFYVNGVAQ